MRRSLIALLATGLLSLPALGQGITTPPNGDNQRSSVTQHIGLVKVTIDYNSPDVHAPNGEDRRGKIWGTLVPWGTIDDPFGTCTECPWRAGANENTVFTVSHDVKINGQPLKLPVEPVLRLIALGGSLFIAVATGVAMIGWCAWQLQGKVPAPLQVKRPRVAATFNIGGPICASVCTVLTEK